jgi:hypothetical protein
MPPQVILNWTKGKGRLSYSDSMNKKDGYSFQQVSSPTTVIEIPRGNVCAIGQKLVSINVNIVRKAWIVSKTCVRVVFHGNRPEGMMGPPVVRVFVVPAKAFCVITGNIFKCIIEDVDQQGVKVAASLSRRSVSFTTIQVVSAAAFGSTSSAGERASLDKVEAVS